MPDFGSSTFSQTDASNATGTMPSWSGSAAPSTLDDAGRALQGAVTREWNWRNYTLTAAGTSDAKTLTYSVAPAAYYNGQRFAFIANTTNTTTTPTLSVNGLTATTIKKILGGTISNLVAGEMVAGMFVEVAYNTANTCFVWVNSVAPLLTNSNGDVGIGGAPTNYASYTTLTLNGTDADIDLNRGGVRQATFYTTSTQVVLGTTANVPMTLGANNVNFVTVGTDQSLTLKGTGGLGYGTGSGGTVTQGAGSGKSTGVTLNKTNGQITMNNANMIAGAVVNFTFTNSTIAATDVVVVNMNQSGITTSNYRVQAASTTGNCIITLINQSGGPLAEAVVINFAVIKAVTA